MEVGQISSLDWQLVFFIQLFLPRDSKVQEIYNSHPALS